MNITITFIIFAFLFTTEILYFKIADKFNIIDRPNHRSSHNGLIIRGGGIIFTISLLLYPLYFGMLYNSFLLGLVFIAFISFLDDIKPVSSTIRIVFHLVAVALLFYQLGLYSLPYYWTVFALIFVIGSINAINFMDGINGLTGGYALVTLCSLLYVNYEVTLFTNSNFLITSIISVLVFNFFNFRNNARCFAGDVGSIGMAFIILFFILQLIIKTENFNFLFFLLLYGLDTATTIVFRLLRKENIFEAHRSHLYQYLVNEKKMSHLLVSSIYICVQLIINLIIILFFSNSLFILVSSLIFSTMIFVIVRFSIEGPSKLLGGNLI